MQKLKVEGKFGKDAVQHMTTDALIRNQKQTKAFVIEVKAEKVKKNTVHLNQKSNVLIAQKFKSEFN